MEYVFDAQRHLEKRRFLRCSPEQLQIDRIFKRRYALAPEVISSWVV